MTRRSAFEISEFNFAACVSIGGAVVAATVCRFDVDTADLGRGLWPLQAGSTVEVRGLCLDPSVPRFGTLSPDPLFAALFSASLNQGRALLPGDAIFVDTAI